MLRVGVVEGPTVGIELGVADGTLLLLGELDGTELGN